MIPRHLTLALQLLLSKNAAVALVGPRQVGKTTLALEIANSCASVYLDLESPRDLAKTLDFEQYCAIHHDKLIVLDEVQRVPGLFAVLRGIIDARRRQGKKVGQFLLLGSASLELLQQSSESLAGRIAYGELHPLDVTEVGTANLFKLWLRGGFPESFQAATDPDSFNWRFNFIRTYLERDIPQLGPRVPAETLRRFWTMLAHNQAQVFNAAALARGLDVSGVTIARYLDLMVDLLLVRRLQPWTSNIGRRLVKAPKIYVRDSGICHTLLGIATLDDLLGHPVVGSSWEGFAIESIIAALPATASYGYYRTAGGAEIDLVIEFSGGELWTVEVKFSSSPTVSKGYHDAVKDLKPTRGFVVHSGEDRFPLTSGLEAITLEGLLSELAVRM